MYIMKFEYLKLFTTLYTIKRNGIKRKKKTIIKNSMKPNHQKKKIGMAIINKTET